MEEEKLQKIKEGLLAEKEKLEKELENVAKKKGKAFNPVYPEYGNSSEDNAAEITEYEIHLALDKNLEKLLSETIKSLAKIEGGTYGKCEGCGNDIGDARLEAFPSASNCIECQSKKEKPIVKFFKRFNPHKNVKQPGK